MKISARRLKFASLGIGAAAALAAASSAGAWGAQGHQYVGSLGWMLLNPNARAHVAALLGPKVDLTHAAVWADCIRSVKGAPGSGFTFEADKYMPQACAVFADNGVEQAGMTDYASRNWTNCEYSGAPRKCNLAYHFADVNVIGHKKYDMSYFGAGSADVVQAIKAATAVLQCPDGQSCAAPAPFNIKDKREALFLLTHFMGDVHQPLHVGAVYLDKANAPGGDHGSATTGGNALLLKAGQTGENLHHAWDTIQKGLGTAPSPAVLASACKMLRAQTATGTPEDWASETVVAATSAYKGLSYAPDQSQSKYWDVTMKDARGYGSARSKMQSEQLIKAGVRLATVLNGIWPSRIPPAACAGGAKTPPHHKA